MRLICEKHGDLGSDKGRYPAKVMFGDSDTPICQICYWEDLVARLPKVRKEVQTSKH